MPYKYTFWAIARLSSVFCSKVICLLLLWPVYTHAQPSFLQIYPGEPGTQGFYCGSIPTCLEKTNDGGFLIGGYTCLPDTPGMQFMQLRKINATGNLIWDVKDRVTTYDEINDVVAFDDSSIFCAVRFGAQAGLVKRNATGDIVWAKNLIPFSDTCTAANALIKTTDGNLVLCGGYYACTETDVDIIVIKIDTIGNIIWRCIIPLPWSNSALDIIEASDSTYLITGFTEDIDTSHYYTKTFLTNLDLDGNVNWFKTYGTRQGGRCLTLLPNKQIAIGNGLDNSFQQWSSDGLFYITDDTGNIVYEYLDTIKRGNFYCKAKSFGNYVYLIQTVNEFYSSDTGTDFKLQRYSTLSGQIDFSKSYTLLGSQSYPLDMEILSNGNIAISYYAQDSLCPGCTGLVVLDSTGCVPEWCATFIREIESNPSIHIYPNPFNQFIQVSGIDYAQLRLLDYMGRELMLRTNITSNTKIDLPPLPNGIYLVELKKGEMKWTEKMVRQ